MNSIEILFLIFSTTSVFLSGYFFFKKKGDKVGNRILGVYLLLFSYNLFYNVIYWSKATYMVEFIRIFGTVTISWTLYPTLIYLYVKRVVGKEKLGLKDLIHFIPLVVILVFYGRFYFLSIDEKISAFQKGNLQEYIYFIRSNPFIIVGIMIFYTVLTYVRFKNSDHLTQNTRRWLKWLIGSFACYVILMATYFVLAFLLGWVTKEYDYIFVGVIIFLISSIAYFAIWQPDVFNGLSIDRILPFIKYKKTGLSKELSVEFKEKLLRLIEKEKPYLNNELRLGDLAKKLGLSRHQLSQVINENFKTSFSDFINQYRIEEVKKAIVTQKDINITEVIFNCGFNNRVSFYKAFKNHTNYTPSEYREKFSR